MDLTFKVKDISKAVFNKQACDCKLAADLLSVHEDIVSVSCLLGVDLLKYLAPMKLPRFINGAAFELAQEFMPYVNIDFLPARKSSWSSDLWYELFSGSLSVFWLPSYPYMLFVGT